MPAKYVPIAACLTVLLLSGCARPEAVRYTAKSAAPIATSLQTATPKLEQMLASHLAALDIGRSRRAAEASAERVYLSREQRIMRLEAESVMTERLRLFNELTQDGTALRQDPFALVPTAKAVVLPKNALPTQDLDRVISGLSAMAKPRKWRLDEYLTFAEAVQQERERIKASSGK
jgi:hypothetical protein